MPWGYLFGLSFVTLCTTAALAPPRRPRLLATAGYLLGVVITEVPHLFGLMLAASTLLALHQGDLTLGGTTSLVLLAVAAATMAGLAALGRRSLAASSTAAVALRHAGVAAPTNDGSSAGGTWRRSLRVALTPLPMRPRTVRRIANLRYGEHRRQRLDVYHRGDLPTGGPVLLYLHGGGYFSGNKRREARALWYRYASRGWVVVSATYRLRPEADLEDHLADAERALAWTSAHAHEFGGDPRRTVLAGSSAGAHLASLCALARGGPRRYDVAATATTSVAAVLCLYGYYGRYDGRDAREALPSTPLALDASDAPPFLIAHGDRDTYVDVAGARRFAAKLRSESTAPVVYLELPGGQHGFDLLRSWRCDAVLAAFDALLLDPRTGPLMDTAMPAVRVGRRHRRAPYPSGVR